MTSLLERLQALTGPDREVDALIAVATFKSIMTADDHIYAKMPAKDDHCAPGTYWIKSRSGMSLTTAPHFTGSIDAAMTLVPEGAEIELTNIYGVARAAVGLNFGGGPSYGGNECGHIEIALCVAAVKAEESQHEQ